jgi:hypothetical protein
MPLVPEPEPPVCAALPPLVLLFPAWVCVEPDAPACVDGVPPEGFAVSTGVLLQLQSPRLPMVASKQMELFRPKAN